MSKLSLRHQSTRTLSSSALFLLTLLGAHEASSAVVLLTPLSYAYNNMENTYEAIENGGLSYALLSDALGVTHSSCLSGASATAEACATARSSFGSWGITTSMADSAPSTIPEYDYLWGSHAGAASLDLLTVFGLPAGTYTLVPTVNLDGEISWDNQWRPGTVHVDFTSWAADGVTELDNPFIDLPDQNIVDITATLLGLEFQAGETFNFRLGFGQTARVFRDDPMNTLVTANFFSTMHVTGIDIFDSTTGQAVSGWTIESASGARYTPNGIAAAPEPGTLALMGLGLAGIAYRRRKRAA